VIPKISSVPFFAAPKKEPNPPAGRTGKGAFCEGVFLCFSIEHIKIILKALNFLQDFKNSIHAFQTTLTQKIRFNDCSWIEESSLDLNDLKTGSILS